MYQVTKTYGHERGFSCCFRQHSATHSHCSKLHGYALGFTIVFESETLDERNWVIDFGDLNGLEKSLREVFDHTLVIAHDDPEYHRLIDLNGNLANVIVMPKVGAEAFAEIVYWMARSVIPAGRNVRVKSVTVSEHGSNSASYIP